MDLQPTDEQRAIVEALHDFAKEQIRPAARDCEEAGQVSDRIAGQLFEMGIASPCPEEFGGQGTFDSVTSAMVAEELAWGDPGVALSVLGGGLGATMIELAGSEEQRARLLPKFAERALGSVAIAERDAGNDVFNLQTRARVETGQVQLSGVKYGVLNADSAPIRLVVAADEGNPGIFLFSEDAEIEARPEDKLGMRSARTFKATFEKAAGEKLGGEDHTRALMRAKLLNAGVALGLARAALEYATEYAKERTAFGRPIGAFQAISFKIADRAMDLESARLLVWRAAWEVDLGGVEAPERVAAACGHAVAAAAACADDGVQILGGHGYMRDHPVEMWYRDALTLSALDSPALVGDLFAQREKVGASP